MDYASKRGGGGKLRLKGGIKKKTGTKKKIPGSSSASRDPQHDEHEHRDEVTAVKDTRTPAQRKFDEIKRIREQREIERTGGLSHQERIEQMNTHLSKLSEHHDMPKIGPG